MPIRYCDSCEKVPVLFIDCFDPSTEKVYWKLHEEDRIKVICVDCGKSERISIREKYSDE